MVEIKRKVTLKTKTATPEEEVAAKVSLKTKQPESQPQLTPVGSEGKEGTDDNNGGGNGKKWLAAVAFVALLVGGYYL